MIFDLNFFFEKQLENPEKRKGVLDYFSQVQAREELTDIKDFVFYKEYVSLFKVRPVFVPEGLEDNFDFNLLQQLAASSFSTKASFFIHESLVLDKLGFMFNVESGTSTVSKKLEELWGFQILTLFIIYIEEQMNLETIRQSDENEKKAIENSRNANLKRWNDVQNQIDFDIRKFVSENEFKEFLK